ncbi:MAG: DUF2791 family P-loop domain-containing protein [Deltaproteobacteria bacterium]|nr:DUF2791 family P-loop domain-containing protein [Deltaproteobacteria bacterium]
MVQELLGRKAVVNFFGEDIDVNIDELIPLAGYGPGVSDDEYKAGVDKIALRRAYEAINLGVVPPDPSSLIEMTIAGDRITSQVASWLSGAREEGLCKVVFGNYGTGKSHYLRVVSCIARQMGWVTSLIEFDPKAADPAKPHLIYRELMSNLRFPEREDGTMSFGFTGLIKEIRENWDGVRDRPLLKRSPWFTNAIETLLYYPHSEDQDYLDACAWLAGDGIDLRVIRKMASGAGKKATIIPRMPKIKETADIYMYHLVVINDIFRALGYKGFMIILDEAEHVRGYNVRRKERANNLFDLLARSAHRPLLTQDAPVPNDHSQVLPEFWNTGPHFALFVGLTEGDIFSDPTLSLRDACVFLHDDGDRITLHPPSSEEYKNWCLKFLTAFYNYYPDATALLAPSRNRERLSTLLCQEFEAIPEEERLLRIWIKLASLVPSILLSRNAASIEELESLVRKSVRESTGYVLPWESI